MLKNVFAATFLLLLTSCATDYYKQPASKVDQDSTITRSDFEQSVAIMAPRLLSFNGGLLGDSRELYLRGWRNKGTHSVTHQFYVNIEYVSTGWKFFNSAAFQGGIEAKTVSIKTDVSCGGGGGCHYTEVVGVDVSNEQLEKAKDTGMQVKVRSRSGSADIIDIPANYIQGYLLAVNRS